MKPFKSYIQGLEHGLQGIELRWEASKRRVRAYKAGVKRGKAWRQHIEDGKFGWPPETDAASTQPVSPQPDSTTRLSEIRCSVCDREAAAEKELGSVCAFVRPGRVQTCQGVLIRRQPDQCGGSGEGRQR